MGAAWTKVRAALRAYACFAVVHSLVKIVYVIWKTKRQMRQLRHVPGADLDVLVKKYRENITRIHDFKAAFHQEFPGAKLIKTHGPEPELMVRDPEFIKHFLKTEFDRNTKMSTGQDNVFDMMGEWLGDEGIFVIRHGSSLPEDNAIWIHQRKTAAKLFTRGNFQDLMWESFAAKLKILTRVLEEHAESGQPIDLQKKFFSFTFDSIQKIFYARDVDSVSGDTDPYAFAFDGAHRVLMTFHFTMLPLYVLIKYAFPFPFGRLIPNRREWNPLWWLVQQLSPVHKEFREHCKYLKDVTEGYVQEARRADPKTLDSRRDLLAHFLRSQRDGEMLSDKRLSDIILNFIIAGRDTSACTLSWMFLYLAKNPKVQEKAAAEAREAFGDRIPRLEDLDPEKVPYLHGVLYETLRLAPPVPEDTKIVSEEVVFPDGTRALPGVRLSFSPFSIGRDPERFEDPLSFRPERWIPWTPFRQDPDFSYKFPVFQSGHRICLGANMAQFEIKMVAATLLSRFSFELTPGQDPDAFQYARMITISVCNDLEQTSHELQLVVKRRE
ncbi:Cytochrome P450 86A7 [Hondaea fermentalgiana]|uniref:Cytochrome P450 86A7 n=1 Tax=Hondaea fermentalgiana TaxID=2315210 RepID=A0A2R5GHG6_9STRA|nr:Cytochrome P450 86A7 [Hondaea fermentalgiana]|eukprot:GBG29779.1 Cytochrome P450 86A7 [Hondaea fermentalgiana]